MHIMSFSEREYVDVSEDAIIENGSSYFGLPNTMFDAGRGGQLMNEYLDERIYAEELGFDGVMLNEHHQTPFCGGGVMDVEAAILARITKRVKIVLLGNPLPVGDPLRLAEELATIDMISGGRLVPGCVVRARNSSPIISTRPTIGSALTKPTILFNRRGRNRDRGATRASTTITGTLTPGSCRFKSRCRSNGFRG